MFKILLTQKHYDHLPEAYIKNHVILLIKHS